MEFEELVALVWDTLAQTNVFLTSKDVALKSGQPLSRVQSALSRLRQDDLVEQKIDANGISSYSVKLELSAIEWAQAVSLGVCLLSLERFASLQEKDFSSVLLVVTDGSLDKLQEQKRDEKKKSRDNILIGRAASQAAAINLQNVIKDTEDAFKEKSNASSEEEHQVRAILKEAHESMEKAYNALITQLSGVK